MTGNIHSKMTVTTPSDREFVLSRVVDAPRALVFEAWTKPEHVRNWWGCGDLSLTTCEIDLRPGGAWRYVMTGADGTEYPFKGVYSEIAPPERLVYTEVYDVEPYSDFEALNTVLFTEEDGKTRITSTILHKTTEARDGHLNSGVQEGAAKTYENLERYLQTLQVPA